MIGESAMQSQNSSSGSGLFVETTFVLFFLSLDLGQSLFAVSSDIAFLMVTVVAVAVLPFFLPSAGNFSLTNWLTGRGAIAVLGVLLGVGFNQIVGVVLPEIFRLVPLTLAMFAGLAACFLMFKSMLSLNYVD